MIASLWSNSNYDDDKGTRKNAIEELEQHYDEATEVILNGVAADAEEEIDENNPFMAPAIRAARGIETPRADDGAATVKDVVEDDYSKFIDQ